MNVILASYNELGSVPSLSISWKSLKSIGFVLQRSSRIHKESIRSWTFFGRGEEPL
jgi:hypothetical protein